MWVALTTFVTSGLVGGAHLLSWNAQFPRERGQILWRVCSVYALIGPWSAFPLLFWYVISSAVSENIWERFGLDKRVQRLLLQMMVVTCIMCWLGLLLMYAAARYLLFLLIVYSFYSLPEDVYATPHASWLSFIPFFH